MGNNFHEKIRDFLADLHQNYSCTYAEIARGLNCFKKDNEPNGALIKKVINGDSSRLSITGTDLYALITRITDPEIYKTEKFNKSDENLEQRRADRDKQRRELKDKWNPDDLLISFGFTPLNSQLIYITCPARKQKILNLVNALDSGLLNDNQFMLLSQVLEDQVTLAYGNTEDKLYDRKNIEESWLQERQVLSRANDNQKKQIKDAFLSAINSDDLYNIEFLALVS